MLLEKYIRELLIKENIEDNQYRSELITFSNEVLKHLSGAKYKYFTRYSEGHNMFGKPIEIAFLRSFRDGVDIRHVLKQCFEDNRENIADCVSKCERLWSSKADIEEPLRRKPSYDRDTSDKEPNRRWGHIY